MKASDEGLLVPCRGLGCGRSSVLGRQQPCGGVPQGAQVRSLEGYHHRTVCARQQSHLRGASTGHTKWCCDCPRDARWSWHTLMQPCPSVNFMLCYVTVVVGQHRPTYSISLFLICIGSATTSTQKLPSKYVRSHQQYQGPQTSMPSDMWETTQVILSIHGSASLVSIQAHSIMIKRDLERTHSGPVVYICLHMPESHQKLCHAAETRQEDVCLYRLDILNKRNVRFLKATNSSALLMTTAPVRANHFCQS